MTIDVEVCTDVDSPASPREEDFARWAEAALAALPDLPDGDAALSIRLVDRDESAALNARYRQKQGATNILSFPAGDQPGVPGLPLLLGDLAMCLPVIEEEALAQSKSLKAHFAHLTVHGVLHLCGYDHEEASEAEHMEALETRIITGLGFPAPYA